MNSEIKTIESVIRINSDASQFFKSMQEKAKSFELKRRISALYEIHKNIVQNLKIHMANKKEYFGQKSLDNDFLDSTGFKPKSATKKFQKFLATLKSTNDSELAGSLEQAQDKCMNVVQDMMNHSDLLRSTQHAVAHQMDYLKNSCDYFKSLKAVC